MRNVKNQDVQRLLWVLQRLWVCDDPWSVQFQNILRLLLESEEAKTYYMLWKTLTQTWREGGRSQPSHKEHMKPKKAIIILKYMQEF